MIISSSDVSMASKREYSMFSYNESASITQRADKAVVLDVSDESKSLMEQMKDLQKEQEESFKNLQVNVGVLSSRASKVEQTKQLEDYKDEAEMKLELLRRILESLRRGKGNRASLLKKMKSIEFPDKSAKGIGPTSVKGLSSPASIISDDGFANEKNNSKGLNTGGVLNLSGGTSLGQPSMWVKQTVQSGFYAEREATAFTSTGSVVTNDGRKIEFGVSIEMSRAFMEKYETYSKSEYMLTDPLVINMDVDIANVSDQKFLFDINGDGKEEEISKLGAGSGFLALDKNGDGKINNGNELFGTKSGDGFKDLSAYDKDGNGWIDEADDIFDDLKVWTKDEQGNDKLIALSKSGVEAIFLKNLCTGDI